MVQPPYQSSIRQRFNISRLAIAHSWITVCFWLALSVAGLFAFSGLKYALFPEITFPVVVVQASASFPTALQTETQLTYPLEQSVKSVKGIHNVQSSTYPGRAIVSLFFDPGTDLESSTQAVETILKQVALPPKTTINVSGINLNETVAASYAIKSDGKTLKELTQIAKEQILPPIAGLPGVLRVDLLGDATQPDSEETEKLSKAKIDTPQTLVRFNAENALAFQVIKQANANTLDVVSRVEKAVQKLQANFPQVQLVLAESEAKYIREATDATIEALILAVVLAVLVIFPFLRSLRATLITALAIPISLLGTCIVMAIFGFNLETITLLALALVIGIIVDDAIVDVENISRHIQDGATPRQAALEGTDEIGLTVSASTLTIVAVFLPVAFMGNTLGQFFKPFGLTVSAAVLISLLVARTLSPVLAVYWLKPRQSSTRTANTESNQPKSNGFIQQYRNLLAWSLNHQKIVVGLAVLSLIVGIALIPLIPTGFIPKLDRGEFNIVYTSPLPEFPKESGTDNPTGENSLNPSSGDESQVPTPSRSAQTPSSSVGTSSQQSSAGESDSLFGEGTFDWLSDLAKSPLRLLLNRTRRVAEQLETVVLRSPEVESVYTIVGNQQQPNKGKLYVKLKDKRQFHTAQVQDQIRAALPKLDGVTSSIQDIPFVQTGGEGEKPVKIALLGNDLKTLTNTAKEIKSRIDKLPGFVDVTATNNYDKSGDINQIERQDGQRVAYISANLGQGQALGNATDQAVAQAKAVLPPGVTLDLGGDSARLGGIIRSFAVTLGLALACMLLVLVVLFGRFLEPLVVLLSIPLSLVGAMLGLLLTQSDFGMISLIGLIFLLGIIDKNAILLVDYIRQLRQSGLSRTEAILQTGQVRLRPILMTTASTILGMLPIALGWGAGAELRQPMAVAIIGGLVTSTLLSLIVVPVLYALMEDLWLRVSRSKLD
jgi:multidrug efflux pump subunit AcrB